ncbi:MAG: cation-translocating P-type ATPase [Gammaproteobacteria bacterium]
MKATSPESTSSEPIWTLGIDESLAQFSVDSTQGLASQDARRRQLQYGRNQLQAAQRRSLLSIVVDQFKNIVILLLAAAGTLAFLFGDHTEGLAIFAVIGINSIIGFLTEWRAIRSMEALKDLGRVNTVVIRDGVMQQIPADDLVPGDIVIFEGGDIVTADIRLIEAAKLQADESTLTGESLPISKQIEVLALETPMMERSNMVFKGTAITRGTAKGMVSGTGLNTELGRISELVSEAESQQTPLEKRLNALGGRLAGVVLVIASLIAIAGILAGRDTYLAIEVAVALAVAAIPEGLPIVATIALARGMWRMAKRNALIARLSAVETLGATSVILTDKTGTLTENRMEVTEIRLPGADITTNAMEAQDAGTKSLLDDLLITAVLCNNASVQETPDGDMHAVGDPTELALLVAALQRGKRREDLVEATPEIDEVPFNPDTKLMATFHRNNAEVLVAVKGAPESVVPICQHLRTRDGDVPLTAQERIKWLECASELGNRGLRTLAIANKTTSDAGEEPYADLVLLGIAGLEDPPRDGVKSAIDRCHSAGISIVMVTGDHLATARNIAGETGIIDSTSDPGRFVNGTDLDDLLGLQDPDSLLSARVISRATPEQKLNLIDFYQKQGYVVAMTGDGVNDAPALKKADIGVAMGIRGTAVAKEAAHMVLQDDELGTIVEAVGQGRTIYENIRKFVVYLMSCNISELLVVSLATVAGAPLPLLPLQILFLNLVTDVFPALALGVGEGSTSLMKSKPRPASESLLTRSLWIRIGLQGSVISVTVLSAMAIAVFYLHFDADRAVTVSFCTLAFAQLWHVFNMRGNISHIISNEITRNIWVWIAIVFCTGLILSAIYSPLASQLLKLTDPQIEGWLVIVPMSLIPLFLGPLVRHVAEHKLDDTQS